LVIVLGYDIGGANTKAAYVDIKNGRSPSVKVAVEYFPVWKEPDKLTRVLLTLKEQLNVGRLDAIAVTMTAELSDAYQTKREGVHKILDCVKVAFPTVPTFVLTTNATLISLESAENNPLVVAAANWAATGWLVAQCINDAVVVDVGSTSTSIIPIVNRHLAAQGKTDLDKLKFGELVYTGSLRTSVAAIVQSIPVKGSVVGVSSELFALSGDVHLLLGNIAEAEYTSETADGRGKTEPEGLARLSRVVCADTDMLNKQEIVLMAKYIYARQIRQIASGLKKTYTYTKTLSSGRVSVVVTGLGKDFLARKAAEQVGVDAIVDLNTLLPKQTVYATPVVGLALMAAAKLTGEPIVWKSQ